MSVPVQPVVDYTKLKSILTGPNAASLPQALRDRMQAAVTQHEADQMAVKPDASYVSTPADEMARHATAVQVAQHETLGDAALKAPVIAIFDLAHQLTLGVTPDPYGDPEVMGHYTQSFKPVMHTAVSLVAMAGQAKALVAVGGWGLSLIRKLPMASAALEAMPTRLAEIGVGAYVGAGIDAMRAGGVPENPDMLDPAGKIARKLTDAGVPDRLSLAAGGAITGGAIGAVFAGIASGWKAGNKALANKLPEESVAQIRGALTDVGVPVAEGADRYTVTDTFLKNFRKTALNTETGPIVADQLSREAWITNELLQSPTASGTTVATAIAEQDGRLLAGLFRNNPGGTSIVTGLTSPEAVDYAVARLGVKLAHATVPRGLAEDGTQLFDVMIARPKYEYEPAAGMSKLTNKITERLSRLSREASQDVTAPKTNQVLILADGTPIRGGINTAQLAEKLKLPVPVVEGVNRPDMAVQEYGRFINMEITKQGEVTVSIPRRLTNEQFNALGRGIDAMHFDKVTLQGVDGKTVELVKPLGSQIQDAVTGLITPKATTNGLTPQAVDQFRRTGIFPGQAGQLRDGTPVELLSKQGALKGQGQRYKVKDSLTGETYTVGEKGLTILPTTLTSEMQPSNLFTQYMPQEDRVALAKLRTALVNGWGDQITRYRDLESFAASRGYYATQGKGGRVSLVKAMEGGGGGDIQFKDLKSAVEYIRKDVGPMPELTPELVNQTLGVDKNIGGIGGGGPPTRPNELVPLDWDRHARALDNMPKEGGPTFGQLALKPMMPLMRDLDAKFGTQMHSLLFNVQSQEVAMNNFKSAWWEGAGGKLPDGVMPLKQIRAMAGKGANLELMFDYNEVPRGSPDAVAIAAQLQPHEVKAADELRRWFDAIYEPIGVDAAFVQEFMPHYRTMLQEQGAMDMKQAWGLLGRDVNKLPKGFDWVSNHTRDGLLDVYDKDPFRVAVSYLNGGAKAKYMNQVLSDAKQMVQSIAAKNENVALPLAQALQSMGGYEFAAQRDALRETFTGLFNKLPGSSAPGAAKATADHMVDYLTSAVYSSTMGFRPGLAIRNAFQTVIMSYPLYNGRGYMEALGRALTRDGVEEALRARVLSTMPSGFMRQDIEEGLRGLPEWVKKTSAASTYLYDKADEYTRVSTYFAAKSKAQEALEDFSKTVARKDISPGQIELAKNKLLRDSRVYIQGEDMGREFLRRAGNSPDAAAEFAGKLASDMTNFLYGRGMQARWMRSMGGRFLGQFGTWSMWYGDYLGRIIGAAAKGPNRADAMAILGRHALVNTAIVLAGKEVLDVDLNRWASYGSVFYSGGPGWGIAQGASTLMRGLGDVSTFGENPLGAQRVKEGSKVIWNTLPSFVPYFYAGRDAIRMLSEPDATARLAAALGTRPTVSYSTKRKIDILLGTDRESNPFQSNSPVIQDMLNQQVQGVPPVDIRGLPQGMAQSSGVHTPTAANASPGGSTVQASQVQSMTVPRGVSTPPTSAYRSPGESTHSTETKPVPGY